MQSEWAYFLVPKIICVASSEDKLTVFGKLKLNQWSQNTYHKEPNECIMSILIRCVDYITMYVSLYYCFLFFFFLYCFCKINRYRSVVLPYCFRYTVLGALNLYRCLTGDRKQTSITHSPIVHTIYQYGCPRSAQLPLGTYI